MICDVHTYIRHNPYTSFIVVHRFCKHTCISWKGDLRLRGLSKLELNGQRGTVLSLESPEQVGNFDPK